MSTKVSAVVLVSGLTVCRTPNVAPCAACGARPGTGSRPYSAGSKQKKWQPMWPDPRHVATMAPMARLTGAGGARAARDVEAVLVPSLRSGVCCVGHTCGGS